MPDHKNYKTFNQRLVTDLGSINRGELKLKSVSKTDAIDSQSSAYKTSNSVIIQSHNEGALSERDLVSIDSCTKTITADAVRKMLKDHPGKFPGGLDSKANIFLPQLKTRFPNSPYITGHNQQSAEAELTEQITIKDLLNHISGLGNQTHKDFDERIKANPNQRLREGELLEIDREKGEYGKTQYSNQGYELLGMILCALEQDIQQRDQSNPVQFSEIIEKYVLAPRGLPGKIFASSQMEIVENKVQVKDHPELNVTSGKYYHGGQLHGSRPFNYDQFGAGGCYASTNSMVQYMNSLTYEELKEVIQNNNSVTVEQGDKHYLVLRESGGFNTSIMEVETGRIDISFGGMGFGNNSGASGTYYPDGQKALAFTAMNSEDLTYSLALAELNGRKLRAEEYPELNDEIYNKIHELKSGFSEQQLLQMRNNLEYDKGLNPTTPQFTSYINASTDWGNIGNEIIQFNDLLQSPNEHERVDAEGYVLTCMFKILNAIDEYDNERKNKDGSRKRDTDPRKNINEEVRKLLGGDLSLPALKAQTISYSNKIIEQRAQENTAPALSSVASVYGTRAFMQHLGLATKEEMEPEITPQKYYQDISVPMQDNIKKNAALAMEKFEESAELGNVRSMGSVVSWAENCKHPELQRLSEKWTVKAATSLVPNPNSQIDYGDMLKELGDIKGAEGMYKKAQDIGLEKASARLDKLVPKQELYAAKIQSEQSRNISSKGGGYDR